MGWWWPENSNKIVVIRSSRSRNRRAAGVGKGVRGGLGRLGPSEGGREGALDLELECIRAMVSVVTGAGGRAVAVAVATLARRTRTLTFAHKLSVRNPWQAILDALPPRL